MAYLEKNLVRGNEGSESTRVWSSLSIQQGTTVQLGAAAVDLQAEGRSDAKTQACRFRRTSWEICKSRIEINKGGNH